MDWNEVYKGYLSRCKSKPLGLNEFIRLRERIIHNKRIEEKRKEWFTIKGE